MNPKPAAPATIVAATNALSGECRARVEVIVGKSLRDDGRGHSA
jgi:hypothetical protein